jgi:hypothetical protein
MRRSIVVVALSLAPVVLGAQIRPRTRPQPTLPQPLPPEVPTVNRALAIQRSRWSFEGYGVIDAMQVPVAGGLARYTTVGSGTHGDYRVTDRWFATVDATTSFLGSPSIDETGELGTRYSPLTLEHETRPFFDLRGSFMHMYDAFLVPIGAIVQNDPTPQQYSNVARYTRGFGGVIGTGIQTTVSPSLSLTTELSLFRSRLSSYHLTTTDALPVASDYWITGLRLTVGLNFNRVQTMHLDQNPRQ